MRDGLSRLLPVAIGLSLVAGLGATPVMAQEEVTPAAGINADRVDGLNAIKSTGKKNERKRKLMAFAASGYLPAIVVKGVAATLAQLGDTTGAVNEADNPCTGTRSRACPRRS